MEESKLRELAERFRRRGYTSTAILLEADAWIAEHPEDATFRAVHTQTEGSTTNV